MKFPNLGELSKRHFFAGLLVITPLAVIGWIGVGLVRLAAGLLAFLPYWLQPSVMLSEPLLVLALSSVLVIGLVAILAMGVTVLGWASQQFLGRKVLEVVSEVIHRIPVIRSVYSALDQLLRTLAAGDGKQFNRVVYVEYPRVGCWTLAFVTGPSRAQGLPPGCLNLYIPTTPNPTSGFYLIVPEDQVKESHLRVEEAFKVILSLGIAHG